MSKEQADIQELDKTIKRISESIAFHKSGLAFGIGYKKRLIALRRKLIDGRACNGDEPVEDSE